MDRVVDRGDGVDRMDGVDRVDRMDGVDRMNLMQVHSVHSVYLLPASLPAPLIRLRAEVPDRHPVNSRLPDPNLKKPGRNRLKSRKMSPAQP